MLETLKSTLPCSPQFLLCILPKRKNSDLYGPWKKRNLVGLGIVTQCIAPTKIIDQYHQRSVPYQCSLENKCKVGWH
ncbi:hypothetical protein P3S68_022333 [Capsicum galapagoense]